MGQDPAALARAAGGAEHGTGTLYREGVRQGTLMGFLDLLYILGILVLAVIRVLLVTRKPKRRRGTQAGH